MKSTYQMMNALVTLPPIGKAVKDGSSNTRISSGEVRVKICAVDPGWPQFTFRDFLPEPIVLSDFSRGGYSDKPWRAGQEIMVPDGYLIIAMLVDDNGKSLKDELLPISLEELPNNDWVRNKSASHDSPSTSGVDSNIEAVIQSALSNEATASELRKIIDKSIEESIRLNCRPGGAIWQAIRRV